MDVIRTGGVGTHRVLSETKQGVEVLFESLRHVSQCVSEYEGKHEMKIEQLILLT